MLYEQTYAQYQFTGEVTKDSNYRMAYLSLVEDYRKISGVYEDQIIKSAEIKDGTFQFSGTNLATQNRIYRIHIDSCTENTGNGHFNGQCESSRAIAFVANNKDTIHFPLTFGDQLLCSIESSKRHTKTLVRVDSIKELMTYDFLSYRSETNKKLNNKNWFAKLQQFGITLNEPLAELYSYQLLSDRSSEFYDYYLEDLQSNAYYESLLNRLEASYPDAEFTTQYKLDIAADNYRIGLNERNTLSWSTWLYVMIPVVLIMLFYLFPKKKPKKTFTKELLTQQEQKVLDLILENKTNKEIAQEIFVSVSTVKSHINNLYKKLKVTSRDQVKALYNN